VEAIHRLARGGGEREMKARTGGSRINAARKDRKRRLAVNPGGPYATCRGLCDRRT
jgi:hypothetical protein